MADSGIYSTVNGTTLDMYLKNMRNMLMEQLTESELIIINRCPEGVDRSDSDVHLRYRIQWHS